MRIKDSSVEMELHPTLTNFLFDVDAAYVAWGDELVVTSGSEHTTRHGVNSLHYAIPGCAADVRIWERADVPSAAKQLTKLQQVAESYCARHKIPTNWIEVILESDHIHIEFQPKRKG